MASAVRWPGASGSRTDAASTTVADMVRSVSMSEAWAMWARVVAFTTATGSPGTSGPLTSQSSAFFSAPGTPWAYSGLQITNASAPAMAARHRATAGGGVAPSPSRSGLNAGRSARPSKRVTRTCDGASAATASSTAPFDDTARRLPDTVSRQGGGEPASG